MRKLLEVLIEDLNSLEAVAGSTVELAHEVVGSGAAERHGGYCGSTGHFSNFTCQPGRNSTPE